MGFIVFETTVNNNLSNLVEFKLIWAVVCSNLNPLGLAKKCWLLNKPVLLAVKKLLSEVGRLVTCATSAVSNLYCGRATDLLLFGASALKLQ